MSPDSLPTRDDLARLVDRFYDTVRADALLGPVFNAAIDDWDAHKATLVDFWSSVILGTGGYRGNPMAAHRPHPIVDAHFGHWLALWHQTTSELLPPAHATLLQDRAARIATSLRYGLGLDPHRPLRRSTIDGHPPRS